ncbi:MAG: hypothetical protein ACK5YI_15455 [Rhodospirillales bacterium]
MPNPFTIAIDLEGVLISNAVSQFPRPGAGLFVSACRRAADRVVLYTSVPAERAADTVGRLVADGHLPPDPFDAIVHAQASVKPLVGVADVLFDDAADVAPGEEHRLVRVAGYDPIDDSDTLC